MALAIWPTRQAAVTAARHPKWDERPVAIVVLKQGASVTAGELRAFPRAQVRQVLPDGFVFTSQIPLTAAGKFEKSTLRQQYGDLLTGQPRPREP
jgi:fatty-acyl-CoA synthase